MGLIDLLQAGDVDGFNAARDTHARVELFAEELCELKLHGVDLSGAKLEKSDLTESDLTEANLVRADLSDIDGTSMILDGVLGMQARLRDAWLEEADLTGADFSHGDLSGAVLNRTKGEGLRLLQTKLNDAEGKEAVWPLADLGDASFKGADFTGADLSRARMTEGRGGASTFSKATLDGIDAAGLKLGGATLVGTSLRGARLVGAHLADADLTGADLRDADLTRANLTGAVLAGADLRGTILVDACLDNVDLSAVGEVEDADLTGVDAEALGLDEARLTLLAGHGARFDPDAPLFFDDAFVAVDGDVAAVLWVNPDDVETTTLRWGLVDGGGTLRWGVLPVAASSVMFHTAVATKAGFRLLALVDRADGVVLMSWVLPRDGGRPGAPIVSPLGYDPAVLPIVRVEDDGVWLWGLARRGPTIVIQRDALDGEGFQLVRSDPRPQARGFLGRSHPVLFCKGGVAMEVEQRRVGPPRRTPDGFPSRTSVAVPAGDQLFGVWLQAPSTRDPGGLRVLDLAARVPEDPEALTQDPLVTALDGMPDGDEALLAWAEDAGPAKGRVLVARLPHGDTELLDHGGGAVEQVRLLRSLAGDPLVAVTTLAGTVKVYRPDGTQVTAFEDPA